MKILFPLFAIATLIEIWTIIQVGEVIGGFNTILLIVLTAFIGSFLVKQQGIATLNQAQMRISQGEVPATQMLHGVIIVIAGILLLTPGFITDIMGLLGLIPAIRTQLINKVNLQTTSRFTGVYHNTQYHHRSRTIDEEVIEGEYWKND
jgi:UPF0716 protein FxsA